MKSIAIVGGALATALLTATALIGDAAQEGATNSTSVVKRAEPFTRLTAPRVLSLLRVPWVVVRKRSVRTVWTCVENSRRL
jgi:hypothetical protein